jgi:universal stress protein A
MFTRILIPSDLTDRTQKALEVAARLAALAAPDDGEMTLLHVIETIAGSEFEELASFYKKLEERALTRLNELVAGASASHREIQRVVVYGRRTEEVLRFAYENQTDLIVLASHPLDPAQPYTSAGTLSYKLGIRAPCSVLLVK